MAEPTIDEAQRVMHRMNGCGTVRRLDLLHEMLVTAYRVGRVDEALRRENRPECETCLEG